MENGTVYHVYKGIDGADQAGRQLAKGKDVLQHRGCHSPLNLVNMEEIAPHLDIVFVDVYPGWQLGQYEHEYILPFIACLAGSLTDWKVWLVLGGHMIRNHYEARFQEIRTWSRQVLDQGVEAPGWFALDYIRCSDRYNAVGLLASLSSPESWKALLNISCRAAKEEVKSISPSIYAMVFPHNSILSFYDHIPFPMPYGILVPLVGFDLWYVSDNRISEDQKALKGHQYLFTTPSCQMRKKLVDRLLTFAKNGGSLIVSSDDFAVDEQMRAMDARKELLGISEEEQFCDADTIEIVQDMEALTAGTKLNSYWNRIRVKELAEGSQVIERWSDSTPAIFKRPFGKGQVIHIGTIPYWAALYPERNEGWMQFFPIVVFEAS